jgi:putative phage-type endonuclease
VNTAPLFKQGSPEWLAYRSQGIGCSDTPAIMGVSPWRSPLELWRIKVGLAVEEEQNDAMRRGVELEPVARTLYEATTGQIVEPALVVHREYEWLRASLDGITIDGELPIEIKCPGRSAHHDALEGHVPDYYWPQVQHILFVVGVARLDYVSFDGTNIVIVPVEQDTAYQSELFKAEREFWRCVVNRTPPAERVYEGHVEVTAQAALEVVDEYLAYSAALETAKQKQERARAGLFGFCTAAVNRIGTLTITRQRGRVTLDQKALQGSGVDLDPFRQRAEDTIWKVLSRRNSAPFGGFF